MPFYFLVIIKNLQEIASQKLLRLETMNKCLVLTKLERFFFSSLEKFKLLNFPLISDRLEAAWLIAVVL